MNDTTKHYTHPALGINVYKDNMGYFAQMEKEAQAKLDAEKQKEGKTIYKRNFIEFIEMALLVLLVLNPGAWLVYFLLLNFGSDDGFMNVFNNMAFLTYPMTLGWIIYFGIKLTKNMIK